MYIALFFSYLTLQDLTESSHSHRDGELGSRFQQLERLEH
jgi:hypothetical protein